VKWPEHYELLLRKAAQDEYLLDLMVADPHAPTEAFGFHAQQAAEKLLKAALVGTGLQYPRTHRLLDLLDALCAARTDVPAGLLALKGLTPFAVEFRYDALPEEPEAPLDKQATRSLIRSPRDWVEMLRPSDSP
jgi:HEPN domain-containing protein